MASTVAESLAPPSRFGPALLDLGGLLAIVWSIPLAVLIVGAPVAGGIAVVLWLVRLVSGGL